MSAAFVGIDVGGTKIAAAALSGGELSRHSVAPTTAERSEALLDEISAAVEETREAETAAVGIGVPSVVDFDSGRARSSVNVPLADVPLRSVLGERLGLPVFVDNDATVAALAEAHSGDQLVTRDLVMLTVGTGVGGGLVLGGRPYRGATGAAAELGHTIVAADLEGPEEPGGDFPLPGSLESLAAGSVLDRMAEAAAAAEPDSYLGRAAAGGGRVDGRHALEAARAGDPAAQALFTRLGERLGLGIANAINTFDPEVVAIGGGVSAAGELLLEPARRSALARVLPGVGTRTEIRISRHGPRAGVLGAALLAMLEFNRGKEPG